MTAKADSDTVCLVSSQTILISSKHCREKHKLPCGQEMTNVFRELQRGGILDLKTYPVDDCFHEKSMSILEFCHFAEILRICSVTFWPKNDQKLAV